MDPTRFWSLVDAARGEGPSTADALERRLRDLPPREIEAFDAWLSAYLGAIRREDLWAAIYLIRGGCGDDSFDYFRGWLVSRGEQVLLGAIRDPESLGAIAGRDARDELMLGVARRAYERVVGGEMPGTRSVVEIPGRADWPPDRIAPGVKWTSAFLREQYPKLWAKFGRDDPPIHAISHARFWALIEEARTKRAVATADGLCKALLDLVAAGSIEDAEGFCRWVSAYNAALVRDDLRAACRVLAGSADVEVFAAFRGWLIAQGESFLVSAVRDPDAIVASEPPRCADLIQSWLALGHRMKTYIRPGHDERETIPDLASWPAVRAIDAPGGRYDPAVLRALLPRLTAGKSDEALHDPPPRAKRAPSRTAAPPPAVAPHPRRARHPKFGDGEVLAVEGTGEAQKVVVAFASGKKTLLRRFVELLD